MPAKCLAFERFRNQNCNCSKFNRSKCISWLALLAHHHTNAQIRQMSTIFLYFLPVPVASVVRIFTSLSMSIGRKTPNCICTNRFCLLTCNATFLCNTIFIICSLGDLIYGMHNVDFVRMPQAFQCLFLFRIEV